MRSAEFINLVYVSLSVITSLNKSLRFEILSLLSAVAKSLQDYWATVGAATVWTHCGILPPASELRAQNKSVDITLPLESLTGFIHQTPKVILAMTRDDYSLGVIFKLKTWSRPLSEQISMCSSSARSHNL